MEIKKLDYSCFEKALKVIDECQSILEQKSIFEMWMDNGTTVKDYESVQRFLKIVGEIAYEYHDEIEDIVI